MFEVVALTLVWQPTVQGRMWKLLRLEIERSKGY